MKKNLSLNGTLLNPNAVAIPCGVMAYSFFNDTIGIYFKNKSIGIEEKELVSSIEKETYFQNNKNWSNNAWISVEDEHFMIWMKASAITPFRKTWGKINNILE
jgi:hypothetical protein